MKLNMRFFALFFPLFFINPPVWAQNDSLFVAGVAHHVINGYLNQLESQAPIYDGRKYLPNVRLDENGHTLFFNDQYTEGSVVFNGHVYKNVYLKYDLVYDQLILLNFDKVGGIILKKANVDSFFLHQHKFINIKPNTAKEKGVQPGYFDLLYEGKVALLTKRTKKITETTTQYKVKRTVYQQDTYYVFKDNRYVRIRKKKDLLNLLDHNKIKSNQQYLKNQHLNFRKNKEGAMIALLRFNDSLM